MNQFWQDLRYGARMLLKQPGFTLVAVLTLALGIGVNSALFTVFDAFVLKPLPLKDPGSLVSLEGINAHGKRQRLYSFLDYVDYRARNSVLADLIAWNKLRVTLGEAPLSQGDDAFAPDYEYLFGQIVSSNYFSALGAEMALGRPFHEGEDSEPGAHPVVVLSHGCWQRRLNADPQIVGQTITLQGQPFTVIGVTAREFIGTTPDAPAFWAPLAMRDQLIPAGGWGHGHWLTDRNTEVFTLLGRLKPGVTRAQAEAELKLIAGSLAQSSYPHENRLTGVKLERAGTFVTLDEDLMALVVPLGIGFGLVLLIVCANVANLLLTRAAGRRREIGVRVALGASRWRIVRQLLTESLLLAFAGGAAGLLLAIWTLSALYPIALSAVPLPEGLTAGFTLDLEPDWRVFGFTLLLAAVAGSVAGLAPALQSSQPDLTSTLKDEGSTFGHQLSQSRLRSGLVVAQIAVCLTLLVGAGLLVRSLRRVQTIDTGMTTKNVFSVAVGLSRAGKEKNATREVALRRLLAERLRATPGVAAVSEAKQQPLSGGMANTLVALPDQAANDQLREARFNFVSSEYFETLGIRLQSGRAFTAQEVHAGAQVVVISEATARRFWPGTNPIGQRISIAAALKRTEGEEPEDERKLAATYPQYAVIGVARDTRSRWVFQQDETFLYVPLPPGSHHGQYLLVRTTRDPDGVMHQVRELATMIDPALRVSAQRIEDHLVFQMAPFRALAWLAGLLGMLALLLAAIGLTGMMSFVVTERTREIGIRVALGAQPAVVIRIFLWQGLRLAVVGVICGWLGGALISQLLRTVLIDLSPFDPLAFVGMAVFLLIVALLACWVPARRAAKVDPMIALRYE